MAVEQKAQSNGAAEPETDEPPSSRVKVVRLLAFVIVPMAFVAFVAFGLFRTAPPADLIQKPAPEFSLPLLSGGTLSSSSLKGSPVVVNFWASWCLPCREEAPLLEREWRQYRQQGLQVIGVNVQDSAEEAAAFVKEFNLTFPIVRDVDLILYRKLGVRGLPETFFVDQSYKFTGVGAGEQVGQQGATKVLGPLRPAVLESQIRQLLDKQGAGKQGGDQTQQP